MFRKYVIIFIAVILSAFALSIAFYFIYPDVSKLRKWNPQKTAFMEHREREWQRQGKKKKIVQRWVPLSQISPYAIKAVIIAEDDKFWSHEGFDFEAMKKALDKDLKQRKFQVGGSTISQQLAKNLYLTPSKNPIRKLKEAILTWRLEQNLSKKRIIELYLNVAEWGEGLFGIEAASQRYYGKPASALSAMEAAKLATVLPNPRRCNPIGSGRYVEYRSDLIYQIMVRRGIVIPDYDNLMNEPPEQGTGAVGSQAGDGADPSKDAEGRATPGQPSSVSLGVHTPPAIPSSSPLPAGSKPSEP